MGEVKRDVMRSVVAGMVLVKSLEWVLGGEMVPVLGDGSTLDLITKEMSSAAATELLRAGMVV